MFVIVFRCACTHAKTFGDFTHGHAVTQFSMQHAKIVTTPFSVVFLHQLVQHLLNQVSRPSRIKLILLIGRHVDVFEHKTFVKTIRMIPP